MPIQITEVEKKNIGRCLKLENEQVSVIITVDVGPRVISYALKGMENVLFDGTEKLSFNQDPGFEEYYGKGKKWHIYGGHRLWYSPEGFPCSYYPDNDPVDYKIVDNTVIMTPNPQIENGVAYTLRFTLDDNTSRLVIGHKVTSLEDGKEIAPWALTVMATGGVEIIPQSQKQTGLLSNRRIVLWPYNDARDARFFLGNKYITLKQDPNCKPAFKVGTNNEDGWASYLNKGQLFTKRFEFIEDAKYPDYEVNFETYTDYTILEMESLGELKMLNKGDYIEHEEAWELIPCNESFDASNEDSIDAFAKKYILR